MIIVSFLKVVYPLKYPSNACLSYLDNGKECNYLECQNVIGVLLSNLKQSIFYMPLSNNN